MASVCLLLLNSCGKGAAEELAAEFHQKLDQKEYTYIVEHLIDPVTLEETGDGQWYSVFEYVEANWGTAESRDENFEFESSYNNGISSVELNYTVQYKSQTMYERIFLVDRGDGFKVSGFFLNETKEGLDAQQQ